MASGVVPLAQARAANSCLCAPAGYRGAGCGSAGACLHLKIHLWAPNLSGFGGGIGAFSREMSRGLSELGHDVRAIEKGEGTTPSFLARCGAALFKDRPDQIVSTHVNFGPAAQIAKRTFGVPYTLVAHGIDIHPQLAERRVSAIRNADRLIAVSAWTRSRLLGLGGVYQDKIEILPNTFDDARFTPAPKRADLAARYRIAPNEKVILTVARLDSRERYKGYDRIVEALPEIMRISGQVRFLIVGSGEDRERITALARHHNVEHAVTFAGFVDSSELADHYRLADVFAMPSTGEGFGIVFLEALGCGTPVVAGNRDGSVDALDGGRLGKLIDPLDVTAIAGAISSVLRMGGNALWYNRESLHDAVTQRFGARAFVRALGEAFSTEPASDA